MAGNSRKTSRARRYDTPGEGASLIAPGGKLDEEKLRQAVRQQRSPAASPAHEDGGRTFDLDDADVPLEEPPGEDDAVTVKFRLGRDVDKRLDRYLQDRIPFMSRSQLQRLIKEEAVSVNGRPAKPATNLRLGDVVTVVVPPPPPRELHAEEIPIQILHEDEDIIALNKQAGIITHPARSHKTGTLINALAWHLRERATGSLSSVGEEEARPGVIHRLDKDTTGVIVFGKSETGHLRLAKQFANRSTDKRYLAVVHGRVEPVHDIIDAPIGKHPTTREMQAIRFDEAGKPSQTVYWVREQYQNFALVELELRTGRTHQIRVHLSYLGWPIVGDVAYGGIHWPEDDSPIMARQALHATSLRFVHPGRLRKMELVAPPARDFAELVNLLRSTRGPKKTVNPAGAMLDIQALLPMRA